jgi:hypothetical protein
MFTTTTAGAAVFADDYREQARFFAKAEVVIKALKSYQSLLEI